MVLPQKRRCKLVWGLIQSTQPRRTIAIAQKVLTFPRTSLSLLLLPSIRHRHWSRLSLPNRIKPWRLGNVFLFFVRYLPFVQLTVLGLPFAWCSFAPPCPPLQLSCLCHASTGRDFLYLPQSLSSWKPLHFAPIPLYIPWSLPRLESNMRMILIIQSSFNLCPLLLLRLFHIWLLFNVQCWFWCSILAFDSYFGRFYLLLIGLLMDNLVWGFDMKFRANIGFLVNQILCTIS